MINLGTGTASWFGGLEDTGSGSTTACGEVLTNNGVNTSEYNTPYISLPIPTWHQYNLTCGQKIDVTYNGKTVTGYLADKGPNASLKRICDLSPYLFTQFAPLTEGLLHNVEVKVYSEQFNGGGNNTNMIPATNNNSGGNFSTIMSSLTSPTDSTLIHLVIAIVIMWIITLAVPFNIGIYLPVLAILGFMIIPNNCNVVFAYFNSSCSKNGGL